MFYIFSLILIISNAAFSDDVAILCKNASYTKSNIQKIFAEKDLNSDGKEELLVESDDCNSHGGDCNHDIWLNCGNGKYTSIMESTPFEWASGKVNVEVLIDQKNPKFPNWDDFIIKDLRYPIHFRFYGKSYSLFYSAEEYGQLIKLVDKNDQAAIDTLVSTYYRILKENRNAPELKVHFSKTLSKPFFKKIMRKSQIQLEFIPSEFLGDREMMLYYFQSTTNRTCHSIEALPERLRDDETIVRAAVKICCLGLKGASERLLNKVEIIRVAGHHDGSDRDMSCAAELAGEKLRSDKALMLEWSKQYGISAARLASALKNDIEVARTFVAQRGWNYRWFSDEIKKNPEIVRLALTSDAREYESVPIEHRDNEEFFLLATKYYPENWKYASKRLQEKYSKK